MFVKKYTKTLKSTGETRTVYKLCESYRSNSGVHQYIIISLGTLPELLRESENREEFIDQVRQLGLRIEELVKYGNMTLTGLSNEKVEKLAQKFYLEIIEKQKLDIESGKEYQIIDIKSVKNKEIREIGSEWLCYQGLEQLKLREYLSSHSWNTEDISVALTHVISRAVYPASEYKTVQWLRQNSAVCELTGVDVKKLTKDKLYNISKKLYNEKTGLEQYMSHRTNDLFDLQDSILLYDLTNSYFEGRKQNSSLAQFGRSKEKRTDAKLIVLAQVVNCEGFLKHSRIYQGNTSDCSTFCDLIEDLSKNTSLSKRKPILVMDAGLSTEDNLKMAREKGYKYICVSRSGLKNYSVIPGAVPVQVLDKRKHPIELLRVTTGGDGDQYLHVKSHLKSVKEKSITEKLNGRFETGLKEIKSGISRKGGIKSYDKVLEKIGRLKEKYPRIQKQYNIEVLKNPEVLNSKGKPKPLIASDIHWTCQEQTEDKENGVYFIRTNLDLDDETLIWYIYNAIREIESSFRCLKTDLDLRPIFHKTDSAVLAHLNLGLLAYQIVATIRYQLKTKGINSDWRNIVRIMNSQKCVTTTMENNLNQIISIRKCSEPESEVKNIYDALKYKYYPFTRKKSVVPPAEIFKNPNTEKQEINDS